MILPTKHVPTSQSLIGLGALVLSHLARPRTLSELWDKVRASPDLGSFRRLILTLDMLYAMDAIELKDGLLQKCKS